MVSAQYRRSPPSLEPLAPPLKFITAGPQPQALVQFVPGSTLGFTLCPFSARPPCSSGEPSCTCFLIRMPGAPHSSHPQPFQAPRRLLANFSSPISQYSYGLSTDCPFVPCQAGATSRAQLAPDAPAGPAHLALTLRLWLGLQASERWL